ELDRRAVGHGDRLQPEPGGPGGRRDAPAVGAHVPGPPAQLARAEDPRAGRIGVSGVEVVRGHGVQGRPDPAPSRYLPAGCRSGDGVLTPGAPPAPARPRPIARRAARRPGSTRPARRPRPRTATAAG